MKRLAAVALVVVGFALPACAQRASSHGGFSGHAAQAFHGGFTASAPNRFAGPARPTGARSFNLSRGFQRGVAGNFSARSPYTGSWRYRRPYRSPYGAGVPYGFPGYAVPEWINPYFLGYPDDSGDDDSQPAPDYANQGDEGYEAPPAWPEQPAPRGPYQPPSEPAYAPPHPAPAPDSEQTVTLIFKDGRPPEQIHNYLLTRTTLYVGDQHHRDISTDQLDLVATAKVNHDAGVDFHLPDTSR